MINPWTQGNVPGVKPFPPLGAWMSRRKIASAPYVPPQWVRLSMDGTHPYWYNFPELIIPAGATKHTRVTIQEDFWMLAILAMSSSALAGGSGTFRVSFYEDTEVGAPAAYKYSKYAVNQPNFASNAQEPGLMTIPNFIARGTPLNCKVQNLDGANPNTVDICLYGLSAWWRK